MLRPTALAVALAATLAAPLAGAADRAVDIDGFAFDPSPLLADAGDDVTWTNRDAATHTVTCDAGSCAYSSPLLGPGASFTATLAGAGTQRYHCAVHPSMTGIIFVGSRDGAHADLVVDAASLRAERPILGLAGVGVPHPTLARVSVDVENGGAVSSAPVGVTFTLGAGGTTRTATLPALAPGERTTVTVEWSGAPLLGESDAAVLVDTANALVEAAESNNAASGRVDTGIA